MIIHLRFIIYILGDIKGRECYDWTNSLKITLSCEWRLNFIGDRKEERKQIRSLFSRSWNSPGPGSGPDHANNGMDYFPHFIFASLFYDFSGNFLWEQKKKITIFWVL